ncbi:MAG TPA: prephenate dehydratase [Bryobacteraceae bacterium]|jgi:prephenate dehydratase
MAHITSYSVAFQGERGAFSYSAATKFLGSSIRDLPCPAFRDVFEAVKSGKANFAVVPIENTLHGSVHENYDHLLEYAFPICGETNVRIAHNLIAMPGVRFQAVRKAFSHPVALNQCREFFRKYPKIEPLSFYDTAGSVKMLRERNEPEAAAIASEAAAKIYEGRILKRNIEDDRQNFTRFFLLAKQPKRVKTGTGGWKTSVAFSTENAPGALFRAMACFALRDLNLSKIESRPLRGKPWEYLFYVDLIGRADDRPVENALNNLREITHFAKVLGTYRPTP